MAHALLPYPVVTLHAVEAGPWEDEMKKKPKEPPRIGRKDEQDPDRATTGPREGTFDDDAERSDREAGAGRPVQLDEEGRSRRPGTESPRPAPAK